MPYRLLSFDNYPQDIPNATPTQDGVMTALQAAQLAALVPIIPVTGAVATVGGAPTNIGAPIAIPLGQTVLIGLAVAGTRNTSAEGAAYRASGTFRNQAGIVSLIGFTVDDFVAEDDPSWGGPDFSIVGTDVQITVQGVALTTINWTVSIETQIG